MTLDPKPPGPKGRLIVPGAESEPPAEPPRIVLPPGVAREEAEDLPEYPRLRPLMLVPVSDGQREVLVVTDPLGVIQGQPVLAMDALPILQLLDGTVSLTDLTAALMRESKDLRIGNMVRDFVAQLDRLLMLESPRFDAALQALRDAYHPLEFRPAALEDRSYPADPATLRAFLDAHAEEAAKRRREANEPEAAADAVPRALMAPHLDPRRAGPAIARAYLEFGTAPAEPLRIVIFGTGHSLIGDRVALTRKHFQTPLGTARCDTAFVDAVAARLGDDAYRSELAHREEHSIEFQVLYLQHRLGDRPFTIVPILCGGFHALLDDQKAPADDPVWTTMIQAVRDAERTLGGRTVYVAGVDFSHVGPRFGDPAVDERVREEIETRDRDALAAALRGDAAGWFASIAAHDDSTRICGFAPTHAMLEAAAPGAGRLLGPEFSDEPDGTTVSIASVVW